MSDRARTGCAADPDEKLCMQLWARIEQFKFPDPEIDRNTARLPPDSVAETIRQLMELKARGVNSTDMKRFELWFKKMFARTPMRLGANKSESLSDDRQDLHLLLDDWLRNPEAAVAGHPGLIPKLADWLARAHCYPDRTTDRTGPKPRPQFDRKIAADVELRGRNIQEVAKGWDISGSTVRSALGRVQATRDQLVANRLSAKRKFRAAAARLKRRDAAKIVDKPLS